MGVNIELIGVEDLIEKLNTTVANIESIKTEALKAAAEPILEEAKRTAAFIDRTGDLRKSLEASKVKTQKGKKYILVGTFGNNVFYGRMVEFGTSRAAPHPFLGPAYERKKEEVYTIIKNYIEGAIKK